MNDTSLLFKNVFARIVVMVFTAITLFNYLKTQGAQYV